MKNKKDNIIIILTVVMVANLTALTWFGWSSYSYNHNLQVTNERYMKAEELRGVIVYLDEVLTMSARMAVATEDLKWEKRYRKFEPKLDAAINETMTLWPEAYRGAAATKTESANIKLVKMENRAFDLIRQDHANEACAILFSNEYEDQKRIYAQGMISFARSQHLHDRLVELRGIIVHLDEVLTMSAQMAAATGDLKWEERYREFEPVLGTAIDEAISLSHRAYSSVAAAKTDAANIKLVEMENRAFDLVRQGNSDSAALILFGNAYEQQKSIYSNGMDEFDAVITEVAVLDMKRASHATSIKTAIVLILSPLLIFTWFIVFRAIRRWKKTLIQHNNMLAKQADELSELNKDLDQKVAERTRELEVSRQVAVKEKRSAEDANKSLTAEIIERNRAEEKLRGSELRMTERVKELNCLYELSRSVETPGVSLEEILQHCVRIVPPAWQYPDITCARLLLEGREYISDNYQETEWKLSQDLTVAGQVVGSLDVCYLEECPVADEGPFLKEERNLIRGLTENLQRAIRHKRDEKDSKRLEKNLYQSDKMASIGQLAAGVAHEINNPMGFISSNLNTMNKYLSKLTKHFTGDDPKSPESRQQIDLMMEDFGDAIAESLEGTVRVKQIVADLKSFSRVDRPGKEYTNINEGIESTLNIVWNQLKYMCKVEKEFGDIPEIECFPNRINQVFMNLLLNAGQAITGDSGVINIRTWADDSNIHVSIRDSGCGISEKNLKKIFEPFFTTKEVGKGTGLGLSLTYDIVNKHGGTITVDSEVGKGTEFVVTLPISGIPEPVSIPTV
ncbi:MAG: ATP-binding protein [candidate division Zixibacteria bacterium]